MDMAPKMMGQRDASVDHVSNRIAWQLVLATASRGRAVGLDREGDHASPAWLACPARHVGRYQQVVERRGARRRRSCFAGE